MSDRRFSAFLDALAAGRRSKRFRAQPAEAEMLRTAIALRAARPGEAAPSDEFVEGLFRELSEQAKQQITPENRPVRTHRTRFALVAAAAAALLVGGTTVVTESLLGPASTTAATHVPQGSELRTGTFQTASGKVLGQIVAYRGKPSWVFMNVAVPDYDGRVECMLQVDNGRTVAFGTFTVHNGIGEFSKAIGNVDVGHLRGAKLVTATGSPVAAATFGT
jgi:hypothetical protein